MRRILVPLLSAVLVLAVVAESAFAQRRGGGGRGGGGFRGGGGGFRGGGGMHFSRASARPSVSARPAFRPSAPARAQISNLPARTPDLGAPGRIDIGQPGRVDVGRPGRPDISRPPINAGDIDIDFGTDWDPDYGCCHYHPIARGAAWATGAAIAANAYGSTYYTLPPDCVLKTVNGVTYEQCGNTWLEPQFVGIDPAYVVAVPPE